MRFGGSKMKNRKKCDSCGIFYQLNGVKGALSKSGCFQTPSSRSVIIMP